MLWSSPLFLAFRSLILNGIPSVCTFNQKLWNVMELMVKRCIPSIYITAFRCSSALERSCFPHRNRTRSQPLEHPLTENHLLNLTQSGRLLLFFSLSSLSLTGPFSLNYIVFPPGCAQVQTPMANGVSFCNRAFWKTADLLRKIRKRTGVFGWAKNYTTTTVGRTIVRSGKVLKAVLEKIFNSRPEMESRKVTR